MRIASFVYNPAAAISEVRTAAHANTIVNVQGRQRKRTRQQLTSIYQKINSFASYTSDCSGGVFLWLYNSIIDLIEKQFDFFIIKSFTNIKLGGKITS